MAHTADTNSRFTGTSNPLTTSYTCGAGTKLLVLGIVTGATAPVTPRAGGAPTYNGVSLTQADSTRAGDTNPEVSVELWYLLAPPTGSAYTISIPNNNGASLYVQASSWKPASNKVSALDVANGDASVGTSANPSVSVTTTADGDVVIGILGDGQDTAPTAVSHTILNGTDDGNFSDNNQYSLQTSAGLITFSWTVSANDWGAVIAAFKEASSSSSSSCRSSSSSSRSSSSSSSSSSSKNWNLTSDIIAEWKCNDNAANTNVDDFIGGYDMTATVNTSVLSTTGRINNAFNFITDGHRASVADNTAFHLDEFSAGVWVYPGADTDLGGYDLSAQTYKDTLGSNTTYLSRSCVQCLSSEGPGYLFTYNVDNTYDLGGIYIYPTIALPVKQADTTFARMEVYDTDTNTVIDFIEINSDSIFFCGLWIK